MLPLHPVRHRPRFFSKKSRLGLVLLEMCVEGGGCGQETTRGSRAKLRRCGPGGMGDEDMMVSGQAQRGTRTLIHASPIDAASTVRIQASIGQASVNRLQAFTSTPAGFLPLIGPAAPWSRNWAAVR